MHLEPVQCRHGTSLAAQRPRYCSFPWAQKTIISPFPPPTNRCVYVQDNDPDVLVSVSRVLLPRPKWTQTIPHARMRDLSDDFPNTSAEERAFSFKLYVIDSRLSDLLSVGAI